MTEKKEFIPSPQQRTVLNFVRDGEGSGFVEAVAGSGKTTTLIQSCAIMKGKVVFAAYNKKIADEIKAEVKAAGLTNVKPGTFHSLGLAAWRAVYPRVKIDQKAKHEKVLQSVLDPEDFKNGIDPLVTKLISLARQRALGYIGNADDPAEWYKIVDHFGLSQEAKSPELIFRAVECAIKGLVVSNDLSRDLIDFDDMIYMPVIENIQVPQYDWVLVDEAQDTNPARRRLAQMMMAPGARAMFVGDRHQAIYGFTGADNDAIEKIVEDFNCKLLPLTTSFRCPKAVVREAQRYVAHIEAHESAPEGTCRSIDADAMMKMTFSATDAILCRLTRPLVKRAYELLRSGVACHVEGRDIGAGLLRLIKRYKTDDIEVLTGKLDDFREREVGRLQEKDRDAAAEALNDRVETIFVIAETCETVKELRNKIFDLFQDSEFSKKPSMTLSTVHKSKGREWPRVFILGRELIPSPWAKQDWQLDQENNLIYVACTRAQDDLYIVSGE